MYIPMKSASYDDSLKGLSVVQSFVLQDAAHSCRHN